jgi:hypothetical protein
LKLDTQALALYRQKTKVDYPDVKAEMRTMLTDPHEAFNWKANTKAFLWDGRTPLHSVVAYIQKKVSKNEKSLGEDAKKEAYFFRFRQAMINFPEYKAAIDLACGEGSQTIEIALEIAKRLQRSKADGPTKAGILNDRKVGFEAAAGAYADKTDRIKMLEIGMAKMTTTVEGLATEIRAGNKIPQSPMERNRTGATDQRDERRHDDRPGGRGRERDVGEQRDGRDSHGGFRQDSQERFMQDSRERYRPNSRDRWRQDSRDRGGNRYREDSRNRGGYDSYSTRNRQDYRDQGNNRDEETTEVIVTGSSEVGIKEDETALGRTEWSSQK